MTGDAQWTRAQVRAGQLFDSALPNGGYAHSQGLEGLVQAGEVANEQQLFDFIRHEFADALERTEFPLFRAAFTATTSNSWEDLLALDDLAWATKPSGELRQAATMMGRQTFLLYSKILPPTSPEATGLSRVGEYLEHFQVTILTGALSACLDIPLPLALAAFGNQLLTNAVVPAVKLLQFGPSQVQRILFELGGELPRWIELSAEVPLSEVGNTAPRWDIASANHTFADRRLFIS